MSCNTFCWVAAGAVALLLLAAGGWYAWRVVKDVLEDWILFP